MALKPTIPLGPCPFCGKTGTLTKDVDGWFFISCENPYCDIKPNPNNGWVTEKEAAEAWNTRYDDQPDPTAPISENPTNA